VRETTEIKLNEYGDETHESWISINASKISHSPPGRRLFDSEIYHQHYVQVNVSRVDRKRTLKRDWLHRTQTLMEFDLSEAQWGAFVSSFGNGSAVPATLTFYEGPVAEAPYESRLDVTANEVLNAGEEALLQVQEAHADVVDAFENNKGKKAMREALRTLSSRLENAPRNMKFAADSLTEHAEGVVVKAKSDIEAMALAAVEEGRILETGEATQLLGQGD
jgi:hypothetical protein